MRQCWGGGSIWVLWTVDLKVQRVRKGEDLTFRDDLREEQRRLKRIFIKLSCVVCVVKVFFYILIILRENKVPMSCRIGFILGMIQRAAEYDRCVIVVK